MSPRREPNLHGNYQLLPGQTWPKLFRIKRALWRKILSWRFFLFQRHRHNHLVLERVAGQPFLILPGVFNPALFRTGEFLAQSLGSHLIPPGALVLDMGTGSGVGAIFAAKWARRVVAVDINPVAVRCARINAWLNCVEDKVEVRQGDLFAPVREERFDAVLFNPPFFHQQPRSDLDKAFYSLDIMERFTAGVQNHLQPGGSCSVVLSTDGDVDGFLAAVFSHGFSIERIRDRDLINEWLLLYSLRLKN
jgi:release factor glutamine methyltransferase